MNTYIAAANIMHNGRMYKPETKIELTDKEFKNLKGAAVTPEEWELKQKPKKAAENLAQLRDENERLKAENKKLREELKQKPKKAAGNLAQLKDENERLKAENEKLREELKGSESEKGGN